MVLSKNTSRSACAPLAQIAPVVEFVGVFDPAVTDVGAVVHVGDHDVLDAGINLGLGLEHGLTDAHNDQHDAARAGDKPLAFNFFYVLDVDAVEIGLFENDGAVLGKRLERRLVVEGKRRDDDANADLEAAARAPLGFDAGGELPEKIADGREHALLLNAYRWIAEAAGELERIDPVVVDDTIQIDVADVAFFGELGLHLHKRLIEKAVGVAPEHGGAHFAGGRADVAGEKLFVFEVDVDRRDKFFAVEESADGDFDAGDAALELEDFDFLGEGAFVGFEHSNHVVAVFFFADKQAAFDVLRFAAGLDDVAVGILHHEFDGGIERVKILIRDDIHAGFFQLFLAKGAVVFKAIRVFGAADDGLAGGAESVSFGALAKSVIENDDVGPLGIAFPILGFGNEAVGDVALFFRFDVVANVVAFLENLPGDVTDETGEGDKEKFAFVHLDEWAGGRGSSEV